MPTFPRSSRTPAGRCGAKNSSPSSKPGRSRFDCWYSPTRDKDGKPAGYIGVATNITERHRLERQILEISDREQARIGQDIHDGLCQHLVSLAFDANALQRELSAERRPEAKTARRIADSWTRPLPSPANCRGASSPSGWERRD